MTARKLCLALLAGLLAGGAGGAAHAQGINAGDRPYAGDPPFQTRVVAQFTTPWAIAFLPDGRMVVTEKVGRMYLVSQAGEKTAITNLPEVAARGQNGLLDVAVSPDFVRDQTLWFTYVAPGDNALVLARARLDVTKGAATLQDVEVIWRQTPGGGRGQPGGIIAFAPRETTCS